MKSINIKHLELYIIGEEVIPEHILQTIPEQIGPVMLELKLIDDSDLQYYKEEIDWVASLNDFLTFESPESLSSIFQKLFQKITK